MYRIRLSNGRQIEAEIEEGKILLDGKPVAYDILRSPEGGYHLIIGHKSYNISLRQGETKKNLLLTVNGKTVEAQVEDRMDLLLHKLGMDTAAGAKAADVKAQMPGLVSKVLVAEGEAVAKGTPLLILEAMKMENVVKATGDGTIGSIKVRPGTAVEKNQVLIVFS